MKHIQITVLLNLMLLSLVASAQKSHPNLTAASYNVRWNSPEDGINRWEKRKQWLTQSITFFEMDIVGAQEVTRAQLKDMKTLLPSYKAIGEGRSGGTKGEYSPIFYVAERLELLENDTFWLSDTPESVGSKGWDAALPRIVTWAKFKDKKSEKTFYFFNTHFDHRGELARKKSAHLISRKIKEIAKDQPVILTGDFNTAPKAEPRAILLSNKLKDSYSKLSSDHIYSPGYTFNSWDVEASGERHRIDYVFYKGAALSPVKYHVLDGQRGRHFISDHFPVIVEFQWNKLPAPTSNNMK